MNPVPLPDPTQERMRGDYFNPPRNIEFQSGQFNIIPTFKQRLKKASEEGLLIFVKWGLALVLAFLALQFFTNVVSGATNGTNAVLYLQELQNKGYLPKVVNGSVPPKTEVKE